MNKKAILALLVAGIMIVSVPMVAMAADAHTHQGSSTPANENADVTASGDDAGVAASISANCNVLKVTAEKNNAIAASSGSTVKAESAENNSDNSFATVRAVGESTVEVKGDVKNNNTSRAIEAVDGSTVTAGSATNGVAGSNSSATVYAEDDNFFASNTTVNVTGAVTNIGDGIAIYAIKDATVTAGSATNTSSKETVSAGDAEVTITSDVTNNGSGSAIVASGDSEVVVEGTVKNNSGINAAVVADEDSTVIVYKIENEGGGKLTTCATTAEILYLIRGNDDKTDYSNMTISGKTGTYNNYKTAKAGTALTVTVDDGYTLDAGTYQYEVNGNTYTITVKEGGGVTLKAIKKAIEEAKSSGGGSSSSSWSSVPTTYGSASAPITGGRWSKNADGSFTYYNNGEQPLNNRVWIKYNGTDGKEYTGCFYFDKQGKMQTGWKQIDGEWYYFDETEGNTKGMMQVNTTTPDGYKVDANGRWVK